MTAKLVVTVFDDSGWIQGICTIEKSDACRYIVTSLRYDYDGYQKKSVHNNKIDTPYPIQTPVSGAQASFKSLDAAKAFIIQKLNFWGKTEFRAFFGDQLVCRSERVELLKNLDGYCSIFDGCMALYDVSLDGMNKTLQELDTLAGGKHRRPGVNAEYYERAIPYEMAFGVLPK